MVSFTPGSVYYGNGPMYAEVLRETEPDCRGNLLCYLIGEGAEEMDHGDRFLTMYPDAVEVVENE